ncbi:MAG: hypothetical protein KAT11_03515 [Phycisphaerae bacterium]|nr:hypothetical protein [Phycisphaerae bacterium]
MTRFRWTTALFLVGGISAILLHFISKVEGFPEEVMYVFLPADYLWRELQNEAGRGILRKIIGNVAFFGMLAAAQGALIGLILDLYKSSQRLALDQRVKHLRRGTDKIDLALRRRVLEILTKYDPAGLIKLGSAKDAYTSQADMILARMNKLRSPQSLRKFCRQRFRRELGRQAGKFKEYDSLAKEIWTAYRQQLSLGKREAPVSKGL